MSDSTFVGNHYYPTISGSEGPNDDNFNDVLSHFSSPWTGRKVMIPLTTKAFFEGTLQPKKVKKNSNDDDDDDDKFISEEMVCMNLGQGFLADMSRDKGAALIRRRMEHFRKATSMPKEETLVRNKQHCSQDKNNSTPNTPQNKSKGGNMRMKKGFLNKKSSIQTKTEKNKTQATPETDVSHIAETTNNNNNQSFEWMEKEQLLQSPDAMDSQDEAIRDHKLPYFEIREEYDKFGNEVNARAIHMANELNTLKKKLQQRSTTTKNHHPSSNNNNTYKSEEDERQNILTTLVEHLDLGESNRASSIDTPQQTDDDSFYEYDQNTATNNEKNPRSLSEQRYNDISQRLDELARLEEQDEKQKKENKHSANKLQGKSWGKGFLNNTKQTKNTSKNKKDNENKSFVKPRQQAKRITIREDKNQVKEIPKIGQNSIQTLHHTANNNFTPQTTVTRPQQPRRSNLNPFETDVFSGVIHERSPSITAKDTIHGQNPINKPDSTTDVPQKRMSRFAQKRLAQNKR